MKNILKRNQIMITALAIMIAVAGYLNFAGDKIGDEEMVAANANAITSESEVAQVDEDTTEELANANALDMDISDEDTEQAALTDIESLDSDVVLESADYLTEDVANADDALTSSLDESGAAQNETPGEAVFTSSNSISSLSNAKLVKEQTRAKNKETLLEVINNTNIDNTQKQEAIDNMIELTDIAEKEMSAEILLEAKGFNDAVVSISDGSVDVCVSAGELTDAQRAQIEDIVKRKTGIPAENIIITPI